MKVQLDRDVLADAVQWVARNLPLRPSLPILAGLMMTAEADHITLSGFDYETSARVTVPAAVDEPGTALVSGRLLAEISRSLPAQPVKFEMVDQTLTVRCGAVRFALQILPVVDYPELPLMPEATGWIDSRGLADAVGQVVVAAGRDELLPVFTGVRLEFENDRLSLLATDRYRMALKEISWSPAARQITVSALVPGKVLAETAKSMTQGEKVTVSLSGTAQGGLIGFSGGDESANRQITTRLLDGEFPKVRHLMNIPGDLIVRLNTAALAAAVKRVALVAERNTALRLIVGEDTVTLEASTGDQAHASETIDALVNVPGGGEQVLEQAGFNPHYLADVLSVIDAPYVHLAFSGPGKPCLMMALDDLLGDPKTDYRHVIMLMRLPS